MWSTEHSQETDVTPTAIWAALRSLIAVARTSVA
jgi:hypothetical protein